MSFLDDVKRKKYSKLLLYCYTGNSCRIKRKYTCIHTIYANIKAVKIGLLGPFIQEE